MTPKKRIDPIALLLDFAIDFVLIGTGVLLYVHLLVYHIGPPGFAVLPSWIINLFGSLETAVYVIAGIPFVIGLLSLIRTLARLIRRPDAPAKKSK